MCQIFFLHLIKEFLSISGKEFVFSGDDGEFSPEKKTGADELFFTVLQIFFHFLPIFQRLFQFLQAALQCGAFFFRIFAGYGVQCCQQTACGRQDFRRKFAAESLDFLAELHLREKCLRLFFLHQPRQIGGFSLE